MSSYGCQNKYKTIAWDSVGDLENDFWRRDDPEYNHAVEVAKSVPTITYTTSFSDYYPQVCYSWGEEEYKIDFKNTSIYLSFNDHWKEPKADETGHYQMSDLEHETTVNLVRVNKKESKIKKFKVVEEEEITVTDVAEKIKYDIPVGVEEAVNYWINKSKEHNSIHIVGYYNGIRKFVPVDQFAYSYTFFGKDLDKAAMRAKVEEHQRQVCSDSRYTVFVTKDSTWEEIKEELQKQGYIKRDEPKKPSQTDLSDDLPF